MKKRLYTSCLLVAACFAAQAQEPLRQGLVPGAPRTAQGVSFEPPRAEVVEGHLRLQVGVLASGLSLGRNDRLTLEFALEDAEHRVVLPVVVYSGKARYRYERRREALAGGYQAAPYAAYSGVRPGEAYRLDYRLSVPHQPWMAGASLTYREYRHGCWGDQERSRGVLAALAPKAEPAVPEAAPEAAGPPVWRPDPAVVPHLVSFLAPAVEQVKARASMLELNVGFPVNVTEVRPQFGNNVYELGRADSLVRLLQGNELLRIQAVHIRGYASPEGAYANNDRLARGRSEGFKQYLASQYPYNPHILNARTHWVPEDWEGVERLVEAHVGFSRKPEVLALVRNPGIAPDEKDRRLRELQPWSGNYGILLHEIYPKLRRIELRVEYTVNPLSDAQARELLHSQPALLSLDELHRAAQHYDPGSRPYREAYEIAVRLYPDDAVANHNAAAALLQEGRAEAAWPHLQRMGGDPRSLLNLGAYYYLLGDRERAVECFTRARDAGVGQADRNLQLVTAGQER